jgi:hypothetical protein
MSPNFQIDITSIGLEKNYLYEVLATTFSLTNNLTVPNTASMGIRLVDENLLKIWPYPNTITYKNIEKNRIVVLNFVENVLLYALASLKGFGQFTRSDTISNDYYSNILLKNSEENINISVGNSFQIPYIKQSWGIIICHATKIAQIFKNNKINKSKLMEVDLKVISCEKFKESFKLFNRAENLALEAIILSTRLKIAIENNNEPLSRTIKNKIEENISHVKRFGKNINALKAIKHIEDYIIQFEF